MRSNAGHCGTRPDPVACRPLKPRLSGESASPRGPIFFVLGERSSATVGPTTTKPDLDTERLTKILPPYKVVVLDCQCHSFDDVEIALCRVVRGMTRDKAHQHAWEIHTTGASVVARAPKEQAELYHDRLAGYGLRVTIEPD